MKKTILFSLMLVSFAGYSQIISERDSNEGEVIIQGANTIVQFDEKEPDENYIYSAVEKMPEYPDGGIDGFRKFIAQNYRTPEITGNLKGNVIVTFIVEIDGSLSDIKVIRDLGYGTGAEAIRVLKKSKKWIPGVQKERPVRVRYTLPISINIQENPAVINSE